MTQTNLNQLATERLLSDFSLFEGLTEALGKLRKTNMGASDVKKSGVAELVFQKTGIKLDFIVDSRNVVNAYMMPPRLDINSPFTKKWLLPAEGKDRKKVFGKNKTAEAWVNDAEYRVGGAWSDLPVTLCMFKGLMSLKQMTDQHVTAIFLHELGHVYTYFSLFGRLSEKNYLTMEAIKDLTSKQPLEKRVMALEILSKDLDVDIQDKEKIAQSGDKAPLLVEAVVIAETVCNAKAATSTNNYEKRNIEQIADQFAVYHGAGAALAESLNIMFKQFKTPETFSTAGFVVYEVIKLLIMISILTFQPFVGAIILLLNIPGHDIYDDIEARIELARKQLVQSLKETKDIPEMNRAIKDQIEAIEALKGQVKDRRGFYTLVYQTITPRGRTMYKQKIYMKAIENLLYSDLYLNAAKFGALNNER